MEHFLSCPTTSENWSPKIKNVHHNFSILPLIPMIKRTFIIGQILVYTTIYAEYLGHVIF